MAKRNDIKAFKKFVVTFEGEDMDMPEEANLSDFETFEYFKKHLKKHRIKYNESDGVFTKRDDEYAWWIWDADDKGNSLGWLFMFLEQLKATSNGQSGVAKTFSHISSQ